jgi:hypothetical protein
MAGENDERFSDGGEDFELIESTPDDETTTEDGTDLE